MPRMVVLSSRCRKMASSFSFVTALDLGSIAKVLLQSLHLALCVPLLVVPYLTTFSGLLQWGHAMVIVIMQEGIRESQTNQQGKSQDRGQQFFGIYIGIFC